MEDMRPVFVVQQSRRIAHVVSVSANMVAAVNQEHAGIALAGQSFGQDSLRYAAPTISQSYAVTRNHLGKLCWASPDMRRKSYALNPTPARPSSTRR